MARTIKEFLENEVTGGILLIVATILALIFSNTSLSPLYHSFLKMPVIIRVGALNLHAPLYHWVNDGLMVIFFLSVGLEIKKEILEGQLSSLKQVTLPGLAAVAGMATPAIIYFLFNHNHPDAIHGWAIPTATDIAFALGVLALLGKRIPDSLKIFLMALAIIDDLGAIVVIALFYTSNLSMTALTVAGIAVFCLILLNLFGVAKKTAYFIVGTVLWLSVIRSGVHATLAGVVLAFTIPLNAKDKNNNPVSPLKEIEHGLAFWITALILPLFAFVNAGVNITQISMKQMIGTVPLGILLGLFIGKQAGVFGFSWVAIKLKLAELPKGSSWSQFYGVSVLTGIGFTMSLFIASLAFKDPEMFHHTEKLAILLASLFSGVTGYLILKFTKKPSSATH